MGGRLALMVGAGIALVAGLDAALLQLGVAAPVTSERVSAVHGMLMVLGFIGTVIALERAVALGKKWAFASPAFMGLGGIALISPLPLPVAGVLLMAGTGVQVAIFLPLWRRRRDAAVLVQSLGAVCAFGAAMLFTGGATTASVLGWLIGYVVLLISGERMELARLGRSDDKAEKAVLGAGVALVVAIMLQLLFPGWTAPLLGVVLLVIVAALLNVDVASKMLRSKGLPRFSAACLMAGYVWLAVAGGILTLAKNPFDGGAYDALVHAVMLGFTMSMIFAHAAVILPAVLRRPLPYHPIMYFPAVLLHVALAVRIIGGDLKGVRLVWQIGGIGNVIAVLAFAISGIITGVTASLRARRRRSSALRAHAERSSTERASTERASVERAGAPDFVAKPEGAIRAE
ncbi:MAG: hypothetical protein ABI382_02940 [Nakamurella sp.]